jgi:hypothetical protein
MAMTYTYKVSGIKVYSTDSQTDIIKEATLHIIGTEGDESYENFMPIELAAPSGSFKEFDAVNEAQVQEWLKGTLGDDQLQANKEGLASMHNNPMFSNTATREQPEEKELLVKE